MVNKKQKKTFVESMKFALTLFILTPLLVIVAIMSGIFIALVGTLAPLLVLLGLRMDKIEEVPFECTCFD